MRGGLLREKERGVRQRLYVAYRGRKKSDRNAYQRACCVRKGLITATCGEDMKVLGILCDDWGVGACGCLKKEKSIDRYFVFTGTYERDLVLASRGRVVLGGRDGFKRNGR